MTFTGLFSNKGIRFIRDLAGLLMAQVVVKVVGFATFAYLARVLPQESYGAVEIVISVTGLALLVVDFGLGRIGVRELNLNKRDSSIVHEIPTLRLMLAAVCLPFFLVFAHTYFDSAQYTGLIYLFAATLVLTAWKQEWFLQASEMIQQVGMAQTLRTLVFAALVFALVKGDGDVLWVGGAEVVSVFAWIGYQLYLQSNAGLPPKLIFKPDHAKGLMRQAGPLGISGVAWGLVQYIPPVIVAYFAGLTEAAILAVAQRIVTSLQTLAYVYHFALYTALIEKYRDSVAALQQLVHASNRVIAWGAIGPAMVCAFQAGDLMALIFGEIYRPAGLSFALLIFTLPLQLLSGHQRWTLITIGKPEGVLYCNMSGAITAVFGSLMFVPFFGAAGAAGAGLAASAAIWSVSSYLCKRYGAPLNMLAGVVRPLVAALVVNWALSQFADLPGWMEAFCALAVYYALTPILDRKFLKELQRVAYAKKHLAAG